MIRRIVTAALDALAVGADPNTAFVEAVRNTLSPTVADVRTARALFDVLCVRGGR